jgi:hypothetical protein
MGAQGTNLADSGMSSLEERIFARDTQFKAQELALRAREISIKEAELPNSLWLRPTVIALFAAAVGLFGNLIVAFLNSQNSLAVERSRARAALIVQGVSTGDRQKACENLISFIKLSILDDPDGSIARCATNPDFIPVLPAVTYTPVNDTPNAQEMAPVVRKIDTGTDYRIEASFTVPNVRDPEMVFNLILIYAIQANEQGDRVNDMDLGRVTGDWKPGQRASISVVIPKSYADKPKHKTFLRYCVGSADRCLPGPNLLVPEQSSGNKADR